MLCARHREQNKTCPVFESILGGGEGKVVIKITNNVGYNFRKVLKGGKQGDVIERGSWSGNIKWGKKVGEGKAPLRDT